MTVRVGSRRPIRRRRDEGPRRRRRRCPPPRVLRLVRYRGPAGSAPPTARHRRRPARRPRDRGNRAGNRDSPARRWLCLWTTREASGGVAARGAHRRQHRRTTGDSALPHGGPGRPGVPSAARVRASLELALDEYRLVMLDQRGTGANALRCPVLQEQVGTTDFDVPTADTVRDCGDAIGADRRSTAPVTRWPIWRCCGWLSAWSPGRSTASPTGRTWPSATSLHASRPGRACRPRLRRAAPARPARSGAVQCVRAGPGEACEATGCVTDPAEDLAAVVRETDLGPDLLSAIGIFGIVDPDYGGLPDLLPRRQAVNPARSRASSRTSAQTRGCPPRISVKGCREHPVRGGSMALGGRLGPRRGRCRPRRLPRVALGQALWPFDRATLRDNGLAVTCLNWPATPQPLPEPPDDKGPARCPRPDGGR